MLSSLVMCSNPPGTVGTVFCPYNGWYRRDECVYREQFEPNVFYVLDGGIGTALAEKRPGANE